MHCSWLALKKEVESYLKASSFPHPAGEFRPVMTTYAPPLIMVATVSSQEDSMLMPYNEKTEHRNTH